MKGFEIGSLASLSSTSTTLPIPEYPKDEGGKAVPGRSHKVKASVPEIR